MSPNADPFTPQKIEKFPHNTPFFLISKAKLVEKYKSFIKHFPGASIHYAMKANSEPELLKTLYEAGSSFEVASLHELEFLKPLNIPADRIIYGTSVKPLEHIKAFMEYGVDRFAFDSAPELEKIAAAAPGSRVYVRMSVNDAGSVFKFSEKFGTARENVVPLLVRAKDLGLIPYGISFNVGSQASNPRAWAEAMDSLIGPLKQLKDEEGIEVEMIDIGGGYPCMYASTDEEMMLEEIAEDFYESFKKLPYKPQLILEPGRGIVAEAAVLVANVIARVDRKENTWLFLDAGTYNGLFEAMSFQGSTRYKVKSLRTSYDSGESLFALAGPTGDSQDVITRESLLPTDTNVGDRLVFYNTGAYSLVATCLFNGFPRPEVYFI
jgi:ornithine decarboxylase